MTLVAVFVPMGVPVLLGDLLLSDNRVQEDDIELPAHGAIPYKQPKTRAWRTSGLRQKLCLVNDFIAVGWSNSRVHARSVINDLKIHFERRYAGVEEILEFAQALPDSYELDLMVLALTPDGNFELGGGGKYCKRKYRAIRAHSSYRVRRKSLRRDPFKTRTDSLRRQDRPARQGNVDLVGDCGRRHG